MPIDLQFDSSDTHNELGTPGTWQPLTICDYCDERIESMGNCAVEYHEDIPGVHFCHKVSRCHERLRASRDTLSESGWGWMEMRRFLSFVSNNLAETQRRSKSGREADEEPAELSVSSLRDRILSGDES